MFHTSRDMVITNHMIQCRQTFINIWEWLRSLMLHNNLMKPSFALSLLKTACAFQSEPPSVGWTSSQSLFVVYLYIVYHNIFLVCFPVSLQFKLINKFNETHLHTKNVQKPVDALKSLASLPERNFSLS